MIGHVTDLRRASGLRSRVVWKVRSGKRQARSSRHIKSRDFRCTSLFGYLWPVARRSDELSVVCRSRLTSDSRWLRPHWPQHRTFEICAQGATNYGPGPCVACTGPTAVVLVNLLHLAPLHTKCLSVCLSHNSTGELDTPSSSHMCVRSCLSVT